LGHDPAPSKNNDSIRHPDYLLRVVANEDNGDSLGRQIGDEAMDFRLCSDVNTSRVGSSRMSTFGDGISHFAKRTFC
jgi:hypothetical protein